MGAASTSVSSGASAAPAGHFPIHLIVPTRDSYRLLARLVDSLQAQTEVSWQVTIIDGGSGAEHQAWLDALCLVDRRFRWLEQNAQCPGIFGAMNQGFALAGPSDWLLFWGSDDWAAGPRVLDLAATCLVECNRRGPIPVSYTHLTLPTKRIV